jgi:hypothetical protein
MSKINALRIVNLNYNNNNMKIDDENFEFNGESTLLSLRNGGGKSVMVQIMMAPFVNKRYRDLKDRTFESYFTTSSPTYILTEWVLDGGIGYVLIGMMIKKRTSYSDDDSTERLDIVNFIYEYDEETRYNISNFPVIEGSEKGRKIKSFGNSKSFFEELKKDKNIKFNYYDMTISSQTKNYFDNLNQYKINHKEWESIIKKINLKESGLSELFQDAKNVAGLVEKWFLRTVEDKLNRSEDKIKNFSEIVKKYIYQYKDNQSKIEKKEAIEEFQLCAKDILTFAENFLDCKNNSSALNSKIANLILFLQDNLESEEKNIEKLEKIILYIEASIEDIKYEGISTEFYDLEDDAKEIAFQIEAVKEEEKYTNDKIADFQKQQRILECAKIYEEYVKASKDVQKWENQIEITKEKNKNLAPEREKIGYTLKKYYEVIQDETLENLTENEESIKNTKYNIEETKKEINIINKKLQEKSGEMGSTQTKINSFSKEEENFNSAYKKSFSRNILGYYTHDFIHRISLEYNNMSIKKEKDVVNVIKLYEEKSIEVKIKEREKEDIIGDISCLSNELINMKNRKSIFDNEIEERKRIIKYIGVDESKLFNKEYIVKEFNNKILTLKEDENRLIINLSKLEEEQKKLQTGKTLEIPKDMEDKLRQRDIKIIHGMEWLKKNNYRQQENLKFIENNPFLPYSLIMEQEDLIKLEKEELGVFTSHPIPIVKRDTLTLKSSEKINGVCSLNGVTFFIAFNNKLINEEELKILFNAKQNELDRLRETLKNRRDDISFYENNKKIIEFSSLDSGTYEKLEKNIILKQKELNIKEESLNEIRDIIEDINKIINNANDERRITESELLQLKREIKDFNTLSNRYEAYIKDKKKFEELNKAINSFTANKANKEKELEDFEGSLLNFRELSTNLKTKLKEVNNSLNKYSQYSNGEIIKKDIEDLEARYESLSKEISSDIQLLEDNLRESNERLKSKEEDLINKSEEYTLPEKEYKEVTYDRFKEEEVKRELKTFLEALSKVKDKINELNIKVAKLETKVDNLYKEIKKNFNKDMPKKREEIINKDFSKRIFEKENQLNLVKEEKNSSFKVIDKLNNNLSNLEEFKDFSIVEKFDMSIDIRDLDKYRGELLRDYRKSLQEEGNKRMDLISEINKVSRKTIFSQEDFFKKPLESMEKTVDNPSIVIENLNTTLEAYKTLMEKLQADIDLIVREKYNICESIYEYVLEVHNNIGKIDNNSSIKIKDKYVKMLDIKLPNWEINSEVYKIRVNDFIEALTIKALERLKNNENIEDLISKSINTRDIYNEVVSISNIDVKLYKIEEDRQISIGWDEVSKNSGGEGFLSAFVILSSLLSYMRRDETDIFANNQDGKVIIMDNPFAQTSAEHLLKPLMDIAKKSNTQLICFSGLGGDSIYNRFDNIYVLNLISSKLKSGFKYLKSEHVKGEENTESLVASRFKLQEDRVEQMELF